MTTEKEQLDATAKTMATLKVRPWQVNPIYLRYCIAHGETDPDVMLARDQQRYPGGSMTGFQLWIASRKAGFFLAHPEAFFEGRAAGAIVRLDLWDRFLGVPEDQCR